ncbi:FAD-binding oxidoreductase [Halobacteriovorax sp. HLS]|uniref:NAD(P)/FAD-dependent oxidoreductase n=1 Tax=Halobacteriovorax sp. HLS TaxID=2234000 RepID=UPI000FD987E1|nr:FAD-binding oxidoreductase [Halobacteriovorax sp. HLS]
MSVSIWQDRSNRHNLAEQCSDIIVIGGGIAGLSCAYWILQEDSELKVTLIEKGEVGDGATGRNAGFITCGSVEHFNRLVEKHGESEALEIWKFSETNLELLEEHLITGSEKELQFEKKGSFSLASTETEFQELKKSALLMQKLGIEVEVIEKSDIDSRLGARGFIGGIKYLGDASIHPMKLLDKMKEKLLSFKNFKLFENSEVFKINSVSQEKEVLTKGHRFKAPIVVLATNGYSALLHDYFKDKIYPTRGQILATSSVEKFMEGPCYANFVLDYFRQLPSGELVIGGFRQLQKDVEIGYSDETSDVIQNALEQFIQTHLPALSEADITHRWSGIMGFSVDGQPMVGAIPSDQQIYFLGGFTAHGLGLAFHGAKCLADILFDREIPSFISAKRF